MAGIPSGPLFLVLLISYSYQDLDKIEINLNKGEKKNNEIQEKQIAIKSYKGGTWK